MDLELQRRDFLRRTGGVVAGACASGLAASGLAGCAMAPAETVRAPVPTRGPDVEPPHAALSSKVAFPPLLAGPDRVMKITVCTRPFRADGPRIEVERFGKHTVVHNYGHGGSGWSLSWGSAAVATDMAVALGQTDIAVIGAGVVGLTTAITLQRAGAHVTIYTKERFPDVRSTFATGTWSPDSRIALAERVTPAFKLLWERMCRSSYRSYSNLLGLAGDPIEWSDTYALSDLPPAEARAKREADSTIKFARLSEELVKDLTPPAVDLPPGTHPFPVPFVRRTAHLLFNITSYSRLLTDDFLAAGGRFVPHEFASPSDFPKLKQKTIVNCTGYGARAMLGDESVVPVRGQITRLIPQPDIRYGVNYHGTSMTPRRDGIGLQYGAPDEIQGYNEASITPDPAEAAETMRAMAELYGQMAKA